MGENFDINQGDLQELRLKTSTEKSNIKFKKSVVGGLNPKDVEEYINSMGRQFKQEEDVYKNRIDEFATFNEMLQKERDKAVKQLQSALNDIERYKAELTSVKEEKVLLSKQVEHNNIIIEEMNSVDIKEETEDVGLTIENNLLKTELNEVYSSRDKLAGENGVLKKQLEDNENQIELLKRENDELKEDLAELKGNIRRFEMNNKLKLSEYSEKQGYTICKAVQGLNKIAANLSEMQKEMKELTDNINKENDEN